MAPISLSLHGPYRPYPSRLAERELERLQRPATAGFVGASTIDTERCGPTSSDVQKSAAATSAVAKATVLVDTVDVEAGIARNLPGSGGQVACRVAP
eukprot:CAMPEP_0114524402 /NCGR_PEP_ID=MMETSP0109-20121206/21835_1 /TAXON_ID=29199 /ORGANISM="Chlorarachnion reptans, Strain CCCM449" /LENGTH=96 /DNA_ID=CAMNT_0001705841 /DNA_START=473 /DNA_END=764 /DNA_ORIENTATION=+